MPGYRVKVESIAVGGLDMQIRSLLDRQQFSDPSGAAARAGISSADWPLFGMVWPSAKVLADAMLRFELGTKRVLEVGCGLALASLVVQRRLGDITASDHHPLTEAFLLDNLQRNRLAPLRYAVGDWGKTGGDADGTLGRFDLIIGSDLLYERQQPEALSRFIEQHSHAAMEVLIVDPDRGNRGAFNRRMDVLGFDRSEKRVFALPGGETYKGRLLSYRRAARPALA
jgi:predicted nicotinamide N-methyase